MFNSFFLNEKMSVWSSGDNSLFSVERQSPDVILGVFEAGVL